MDTLDTQPSQRLMLKKIILTSCGNSINHCKINHQLLLLLNGFAFESNMYTRKFCKLYESPDWSPCFASSNLMIDGIICTIVNHCYKQWRCLCYLFLLMIAMVGTISDLISTFLRIIKIDLIDNIKSTVAKYCNWSSGFYIVISRQAWYWFVSNFQM